MDREPGGSNPTGWAKTDFVAKIGPTGTVLWAQPMTGTGGAQHENPIETHNVAVTSAGKVSAFGLTGDRDNNETAVIGTLPLIVLDASDGTELSSQQLELGTYEEGGLTFAELTQINDVVVSRDGTKVWAVPRLIHSPQRPSEKPVA